MMIFKNQIKILNPVFTNPIFKPYITQLLYVGFLFLFSFSFISCEEEEESEMATFTLSVDGLPELDDLHAYEGWLTVDGSPVSTGTFFIDENSEMSENTFEAEASDLSQATAFTITIEPNPDPDLTQSEVKILSGSFIGETASLSYEDDNAIGTGFSSANGKYILSTPTNGENSEELSGVWWLEPNTETSSLVLPSLNEGWTYEGWALIGGMPVSTGKFTDPAKKDITNLYSAALDAPPFPGEDFLTNEPTSLSFPLDLSGETIVISVEPEPDNNNDPFAIQPLQGIVPTDAMPETLYDMTNQNEEINISGEIIR
jgi:hypothetical protein